MVKTNKNV